MSPKALADVDKTAINTLRFLAVDMVEKANSGHPGAPMGQAAMAYSLWTRHLRFSPGTPGWPNRDRFVLSCGHASALLYSLLHLGGFDVPLSALEEFRQFESPTPGHPEYGLTPGVETTTGPLGQGLATAVGMAMAEKTLAAYFNRDEYDILDYNTWVFASDGDLMEGIASEASSLAGHLELGKLIVAWDDNSISIDGSTSLTFSEDVCKRYEAYGWHVQSVEDGNDLEALDAAYDRAREEGTRPSLIAVRTHIGFGSPNKQDTSASHGAPLGTDEVAATKKALGWPLEPSFHVPDEALVPFRSAAEVGTQEEMAWREMFSRYAEDHPELASDFLQRLDRELPSGWTEHLPTFDVEDGPLATRKASGKVLNAVRDAIPYLVGGSADLAGSNNTYLQGVGDFSASEAGGRNFHFGVREHAMGAILNGLALSGMLIPYGGTFLIFSDYMRPAIRLAALMGLPVKYVFTHDSVFVGEDGPTHQPISQLLSLRAIPGLTVIRPADANETAAAWKVAIERQNGPTALALSRQSLPVIQQDPEQAAQGVARGAYVVADPPEGEPQLLLIASGSEVPLALDASALLATQGIAVRVVSLPSWELFDAQDRDYQESILPPGISKRLAIEAGTTLGWERYVGTEGDVIGIDGFGTSAPHQAIAEHFGLTPEAVAERARALLES
ncbi:MAG: transketolase [Nitrospirae bacterium]|nr:transketolase [Nitrospirota bacterium]